MSNKESEKLIADAKKAGFELKRTAKNYTQVFSPDGDYILRIPSTPSGRNTIKRLRAKLIKRGMAKG